MINALLITTFRAWPESLLLLSIFDVLVIFVGFSLYNALAGKVRKTIPLSLTIMILLQHVFWNLSASFFGSNHFLLFTGIERPSVLSNPHLPKMLSYWLSVVLDASTFILSFGLVLAFVFFRSRIGRNRLEELPEGTVRSRENRGK